MMHRQKQFQYGKATLAALLTGMILLLDAMAASPALHELIHKDAGKADHDCVVTVFAHGKLDSANVCVPVVAATISIEATPRIEFSVFVSAVENLPLGRAPPSVFSSLV
jgi:hypothetical protein